MTASAGLGPIGRPAAILTDIEGTVAPIAFVRDVLFPFARARLPGLLATAPADPAVAAALDEVRALAGGRRPLDALLAWMDEDAKVTALKTLQGLIWDEGYRTGALRGRLYPDVPPILRRWRAEGLGLFVYSSGSEAAQRLIFGHSDAGDLTPLFDGFFDTRMGPKREADSYRAIARETGLPPDGMLFLSDTEAELDAAASARLRVCQLVRPEDGTVPSGRHPGAPDLAAIASWLA